MNQLNRLEHIPIYRGTDNHLTVKTDSGERELVHRTPGTDTWEPVQDLANVSGRALAESYGLKKKGFMGLFGPLPMKGFYQQQGVVCVSKEHVADDGTPDPGNRMKGLWQRTYAQVTSGEIRKTEPYSFKTPPDCAYLEEDKASFRKSLGIPPGAISLEGWLNLNWTANTITNEPDWAAGLNRSGGILEGGGGAYYGSEYVTSHNGKDPGYGVIIDDIAYRGPGSKRL